MADSSPHSFFRSSTSAVVTMPGIKSWPDATFGVSKAEISTVLYSSPPEWKASKNSPPLANAFPVRSIRAGLSRLRASMWLWATLWASVTMTRRWGEWKPWRFMSLSTEIPRE